MPYCANCGKELPPAAVFCPNCGVAIGTVRIGAPAGSSQSAVPGNLAGLSQRIVGAVIDSIVLSVAIGFLVLVLMLAGLGLFPWHSLGSMDLWAWRMSSPGMWILAAAIPLLYHVYFEGTSGQTPGKRIVKIRVIKHTGEPCDYPAAFVRNILRFVDNFFFGLLGILLIAATDKKQRIGDMAAGTFVVRI